MSCLPSDWSYIPDDGPNRKQTAVQIGEIPPIGEGLHLGRDGNGLCPGPCVNFDLFE